VSIGPEGIGENERVPAVVLGAAHEMAVSEAVDLLGVDGENGDTVIEKAFDDGAMRLLDGHGDALGVFTSQAQEPVERRRQPVDAMLEASLLEKFSVRIEHAGLVKPLAEVDSDE
jgi:hypothetical protein